MYINDGNLFTAIDVRYIDVRQLLKLMVHVGLDMVRGDGKNNKLHVGLDTIQHKTNATCEAINPH